MLKDNEYNRISDQRIVTEFNECPIDKGLLYIMRAQEVGVDVCVFVCVLQVDEGSNSPLWCHAINVHDTKDERQKPPPGKQRKRFKNKHADDVEVGYNNLVFNSI